MTKTTSQNKKAGTKIAEKHKHNSRDKDGEPTANDIDRDGIEWSIHGSDDEFAQEDDEISQSPRQTSGNNSDSSELIPEDTVEPGEISSSSDEEVIQFNRVKSKVSKVVSGLEIQKDKNKTTGNKYNHLKHDPEFRRFLSDMLDERESRSTAPGDTIERSDDRITDRNSTKRKTMKCMDNVNNDSNYLNDSNHVIHKERVSEGNVVQGNLTTNTSMAKSPCLVKLPLIQLSILLV